MWHRHDFFDEIHFTESDDDNFYSKILIILIISVIFIISFSREPEVSEEMKNSYKLNQIKEVIPKDTDKKEYIQVKGVRP